jgi:Cu(I)/Ag(I) efflux system membrane fusion protein
MNPDSISPPGARPARRFGAVTLVLVALLSAALATAAALFWIGPRPASDAAGPGDSEPPTLYHCPMHPTIVQDHPGDCPICGMKLVPREPPETAKKIIYQCPMHPTIVQDHPGDCPICGMKLMPVEQGSPSSAGPTAGGPNSEASVEGLAVVEIDPARQQLMGLGTVEVSEGDVGGTWRTVGRVTVDETRVSHINVKIPGFVEEIFVDFVGKRVRRGDRLFSFYSPELLTAQEEYLLALRTRAALPKSGSPAAGHGDALVASARRKLALWDVPPSEIERIAETGQPSKALMFYSPVAGVVTKKDVVAGMKLDAGAMPYEIVDLTSVWVLADVYETELRFVKEGMAATFTLNAFPGREFQGRVVFVDPLLDASTRTVKVRLTFANPTGELRPEMFGEVVLRGESHKGLRIPVEAVIHSGTQEVVFVAQGEGKFAPRVVRLGQGDGVHVEVQSGLAAGERVVTRANFLIDSESRLRASLAQMSASTPSPVPESARVLPEAAAPAQGAGGTAAPELREQPKTAPSSHERHRP